MTTLYFDSATPDNTRRQRLFTGEIFVFSPRPSTITLCDFARQMIEEAFGTVDPRRAQYEMSVERYVEIVAPLKPRFMHHPKTKQLIQNMLGEFECDLNKTYLDIPRLRMVTSDRYLTSGVGYAHHPHRDTWYSAPMCQLNWWLPIYDFDSESSLAFHPNYWHRSIKNDSNLFNYYEWNLNGRKQAAQHITTDTRQQPHAIEPLDLEPEFRVVCKPGGVILFAAAHLHSAVPNTTGLTRYSMDIRTVHLDEVVSMGGAPNLDCACTGTSLRDFMRGTDLSRLPDTVIASYDKGSAPTEGLIFEPATV